MKDHWVGSCTIGGGWWTTNNWRETLFYGVAAAYSPTSVSTSCGSCLTVNTLSPQTNKRFVVIAAGGRLNVSGGQARGSGNTSNIANYLEGQNTPLDMFQAGPVTPIFNDTVGYP